MNIESLEKIYNLRFYLFSIRFFPLFFFTILIVVYIIPTYGFLNIYVLYGAFAIILSWLFSIVWVRFKLKLEHANKLYDDGRLEEVYKIYNDLLSETLWSKERFILDLKRAKLFYDVGNYKRFLELLDLLSNDVKKYPKEEIFYRLLKAFDFEIKNEWSKAKVELENIYESTNKRHFRLQACNNIARIELFLGHEVSAKTYYEKAYEILKQKPNAKSFPIVIHNLLMAYGRSKETQKGEKLLNEYFELLDRKDPVQMIEYTNDMTHYARETKDRKLLEKSYKIVGESIINLLNDEQKIVFEINELRMRYNDNLEFDKYFRITFEKIKAKKDEFLLVEKLNILRELRHVLIQKLDTTIFPNNIEWISYFEWCTNWNLSLQIEIENSLKSTETSLSDIRVFWIEQLAELQKAKMAFPKFGEYFNIEDLKQLITYIDEMISIWQESENEIQELRQIIHILDTIHAYYKQTKDLLIVDNFNEKVGNYLQRADILLEKQWKRPDISDFLISFAKIGLN
ncbi:hypothetical protein, partial [Aliarcobacter butzleri]|uniref:hypothetical protein n=1 Tax=Aliarcobacter butzleri TaxID=28197 RepID=UPI00062E43AD